MSVHEESKAVPGLVDAHGRRIEYLRLSLTDRCNFRCIYCMPPQGQADIPHHEILSYEEFLRLCRISACLGISRFKVTGGEPLCRKGAVEFMRCLKRLPGVEQVTLTTNGVLLCESLDQLVDLGIDGINVSLDALDPAIYRAMTFNGAAPTPVLEAMRAAQKAGIRVKINCVPLSGYNEKEVIRLARYALREGYHLRFIELMPVGRARLYQGIPQAWIRATLERSFGPLRPLAERIGNGPAENFRLAGLPGSVGFISAMSKKFCHLCNRIRLTSRGYLKACLHHGIGADLRPLLRGGVSDQELGTVIVAAVRRKPLAHRFGELAAVDADFGMNSVGG